MIDDLVEKVEIVSSHFGYTEDYVLDKTPQWLGRKYQQADREKYQEKQNEIDNIFRGVSLVIEGVFNEGKNADNIMLPDYEEAIRRAAKQLNNSEHSEYVSGVWWKSED
ncbi:hypothetical protein [Sediminibacillus terrae]|uniref:hypothetical protein n=1 Tax=Sediminibacillus terrae TaxID=1562106 RepID=UPI001295E3E6|nr:hypothetical protein [Sediminibacillus terrae]